MFERQPRLETRPPQAAYPPAIRRLLAWYDQLSDWQRVQYALATILFLVASAGYLLGLGSTVLLQRVEAQEALAAAEAPTPGPTAAEVAAPTEAATPTAEPATPTSKPTPVPTTTPFSAPEIREVPVAPRVLPADSGPSAPVAPVRATPVPPKPRNLETSRPEPPAASIETPTPGVVRTAVAQVRTPTPATVRSVATAAGVASTPSSRVRAAATPAAPTPAARVVTAVVVLRTPTPTH